MKKLENYGLVELSTIEEVKIDGGVTEGGCVRIPDVLNADWDKHNPYKF